MGNEIEFAWRDLRRELDRLHAESKIGLNGIYDDMDDARSLQVGQELAVLLDQACALKGPKTAIRQLYRFFNCAFIRGEIRDEFSPMNNALFARFEAYLQALAESQPEPVKCLVDILELSSEVSGLKYQRTKEKMSALEQEWLPKAEAAMRAKIEAGDESIFADIAAIAALEETAVTHAFEETAMARSLARLLKEAAARFKDSPIALAALDRFEAGEIYYLYEVAAEALGHPVVDDSFHLEWDESEGETPEPAPEPV